MKWIKKILIGLLVFILIDVIFALAISFNLKKILIDGVIKEIVVQNIFPRKQNEGNRIISEEQIKEITDDPRVQEILNSPEVQDLLEKYLDTTVDGLIDVNSIDDVELEKDMVEFVKANREVLEEKVGKEITDEMIEKAAEQVETKDLSRAYKQSLENASRNMTTTEKQVLKGYKFIISKKLRIILFIALIIDLLLIALLQMSVYKWIQTLGKSMIASGVGIIIASFVVDKIVETKAHISQFNTSCLTNTGVIIAASGVVIVIVYNIIMKLLKKKDDLDEIPEFSEKE